MTGTRETSVIREAARWIGRCGVVVAAWGVLMDPAAAAAQQSGGTLTETVLVHHKRDLNGKLTVDEKVVTRESISDTEEHVVVETYLPMIYEGNLVLARRVRRVTTARSYGAEVVEETEELSLGLPHEPLRLTERSLVTVRGNESVGYDIERRVFRRDTNGRFLLVRSETEHRSRAR